MSHCLVRSTDGQPDASAAHGSEECLLQQCSGCIPMRRLRRQGRRNSRVFASPVICQATCRKTPRIEMQSRILLRVVLIPKMPPVVSSISRARRCGSPMGVAAQMATPATTALTTTPTRATLARLPQAPAPAVLAPLSCPLSPTRPMRPPLLSLPG